MVTYNHFHKVSDRPRRIGSWYPQLLWLMMLPIEVFAANARITIGPPPSWVRDTTRLDTMAIASPAATTDYYYIMLNYQENVAAHQLFRHSEIKLLSPDGVEQESDVSVAFDPSYQKVIFHTLSVLRNGVRINKLRRGCIRVVQREENMDRHLYDGQLTAIINLTDIRIGDIIDCSFSLCGDNPVFKGLYDNQVYLQYSVPIGRLEYRLLVPNNRTLQFEYKNNAGRPDIRHEKNTTSYCWRRDRLPALLFDINTPSWYDPFPAVSISEYGSWEQVVRLFSPHYIEPERDRHSLKRRMKGVVSASSTDSVILQSIRFVQDHIRYLGFENGINSHMPVAPLKVLRQRFGDCKDKSFLLCEMLKAHGIEAWPLLVNTHYNTTLNTDLPSPNLFNHCVVQLKHNRRLYCVDPTISAQGGDLEHLATPNFRYGLTLKVGTTKLDSLPFNAYDRVLIIEKFVLDTVGGSADFTVFTTYKGASADEIRSQFNSTSGESLTKQYLNFYSKLYPGIRATREITSIDRRNGPNEFHVAERYAVDSIWKVADTASGQLSLEIYPLSMETYVSSEKSPKRTMPYALGYPIDYTHRTVVRLPESWTIQDDTACIQAPSFRYTKSVRYLGDSVSITHTYKTFQDHIAPDRADDFIAKHDAIMEHLTFLLTYTPPSASQNSGFRVSLAACLIALLSLCICIFAAIKIYLYGDTGNAPLDEEPQPIGGWLILIGIGFVFAPFRMIYDMWKMPNFFDADIYHTLFDLSGTGKNLLIGMVMSLELIYNCAKIVFEVLLIVLFIKRRTIFPTYAIALLLISCAVQLVDTWLVPLLTLSPLTLEETRQAYKETVQTVIGVVIWVPYLFVSNRVKQTFLAGPPKRRDVRAAIVIEKQMN
jgi:hypothetical protein